MASVRVLTYDKVQIWLGSGGLYRGLVRDAKRFIQNAPASTIIWGIFV
jgi:hypothetical protein